MSEKNFFLLLIFLISCATTDSTDQPKEESLSGVVQYYNANNQENSERAPFGYLLKENPTYQNKKLYLKIAPSLASQEKLEDYQGKRVQVKGVLGEIYVGGSEENPLRGYPFLSVTQIKLLK